MCVCVCVCVCVCLLTVGVINWTGLRLRCAFSYFRLALISWPARANIFPNIRIGFSEVFDYINLIKRLDWDWHI